MYGVALDYVQEPFEWIYPRRFGVLRRYSRGPLASLRILADLIPRLGLPVTQPVATALLTGIVTDTLGFRTFSVRQVKEYLKGRGVNVNL